MTPRDQSGGVLAGRRILVVEDDALIAMDMQDLLASQGARTLGPVSSVRAALAAIPDAPEAVLLDLNLRGKLSVEVAEAARSAGAVVVLVTGYSPGQLDHPALAGLPVVGKPVDRAALLRVLTDLLPPSD